MAATALAVDRARGAGWRGELELGFGTREERTVLVRRRHRGPLMVQSPFYPEGPACHVYLLHPPGGLVGGDALALDATLAPGSHALLTTPASAKAYRSAGAEAVVEQHLHVEGEASLEWLPAETIVFDGARCTSHTRVELARASRLLAWDGWVLGRAASDEPFRHGRFRARLEVWRDGRPLLVERQRVDGADASTRACFALAGRRAAATFVAHPADARSLAAARHAIVPQASVLAAATLVDGLLACRVLATGLAPLRRQLEAWWRALRPALLGLAPVPPRIWAT